MSEESGFVALRDAVTRAKNGTDATLDFAESLKVVSSLSIKQLHIRYKGGNEYLRLDLLYEGLQKCGKVKVFEFRGRGMEQNEESTLVVEVEIAEQTYQVIYHLPGSSQDA